MKHNRCHIAANYVGGWNLKANVLMDPTSSIYCVLLWLLLEHSVLLSAWAYKGINETQEKHIFGWRISAFRKNIGVSYCMNEETNKREVYNRWADHSHNLLKNVVFFHLYGEPWQFVPSNIECWFCFWKKFG